jgi:hypothetical protein
MIKDISNNELNFTNDVSKIAIQEINKKIYGYKQQDINKVSRCIYPHIILRLYICSALKQK